MCKNCIKSKRTCKFPEPDEIKQKLNKFKSNFNNKGAVDNEPESNSQSQSNPQSNSQSNPQSQPESNSHPQPKSNSQSPLKTNSPGSNSLNQQNVSPTLKSSPVCSVKKSSTFDSTDNLPEDNFQKHSLDNSSQAKFQLLPPIKCDVVEKNSSNYPLNSSLYNSPSSSPVLSLPYQTHQITQQRQRSQSYQFQQQQQQHQQQQQQPFLQKPYPNSNQYQQYYSHTYSRPQSQLSHDYPIQPQFQNSQSQQYPMGYYTYRDSVATTNTALNTTGNTYQLNNNCYTTNQSSDNFTQSGSEEDKEYSYASCEQQNQLDSNIYHQQQQQQQQRQPLQVPLPPLANNSQSIPTNTKYPDFK